MPVIQGPRGALNNGCLCLIIIISAVFDKSTMLIVNKLPLKSYVNDRVKRLSETACRIMLKVCLFRNSCMRRQTLLSRIQGVHVLLIGTV